MKKIPRRILLEASLCGEKVIGRKNIHITSFPIRSEYRVLNSGFQFINILTIFYGKVFY